MLQGLNSSNESFGRSVPIGSVRCCSGSSDKAERKAIEALGLFDQLNSRMEAAANEIAKNVQKPTGVLLDIKS